jgi:hypothetical protein
MWSSSVLLEKWCVVLLGACISWYAAFHRGMSPMVLFERVLVIISRIERFSSALALQRRAGLRNCRWLLAREALRTDPRSNLVDVAAAA